MKKITKRKKIYSLVSLVFLLSLLSVKGYSERSKENYSAKARRVNFSLSGGYAHSETRSGLVDLKAEVQLNLSPSIRAGFGVGYMSDSDDLHMSGNFGEMTGGMMGGILGSFSGHRHQFRVIPLTLSLYYILPINPRVDVFMVGGGGYYIGSFRDISTQDRNAFGAHTGFGIDFKVTDRIVVGAESTYRFVNLKNFKSELHPGFREGTEGEDHIEGSWHFHHHQQEWHFHEIHAEEEPIIVELFPFNVNLNGFSFRAGIKFRF